MRFISDAGISGNFIHTLPIAIDIPDNFMENTLTDEINSGQNPKMPGESKKTQSVFAGINGNAVLAVAAIVVPIVTFVWFIMEEATDMKLRAQSMELEARTTSWEIGKLTGDFDAFATYTESAQNYLSSDFTSLRGDFDAFAANTEKAQNNLSTDFVRLRGDFDALATYTESAQNILSTDFTRLREILTLSRRIPKKLKISCPPILHASGEILTLSRRIPEKAQNILSTDFTSLRGDFGTFVSNTNNAIEENRNQIEQNRSAIVSNGQKIDDLQFFVKALYCDSSAGRNDGTNCPNSQNLPESN